MFSPFDFPMSVSHFQSQQKVVHVEDAFADVQGLVRCSGAAGHVQCRRDPGAEQRRRGRKWKSWKSEESGVPNSPRNSPEPCPKPEPISGQSCHCRQLLGKKNETRRRKNGAESTKRADPNRFLASGGIGTVLQLRWQEGHRVRMLSETAGCLTHMYNPQTDKG